MATRTLILEHHASRTALTRGGRAARSLARQPGAKSTAAVTAWPGPWQHARRGKADARIPPPPQD